MAFPTGYHPEDSDADDEYERSIFTSPRIPTDDETSPIDSEPASAEHTPTFGRTDTHNSSPGLSILEWTTGQTADYLTSLGLPQYREKFIENEVVGEALVALKHEELKEMGVISLGHRLTILKNVYDVKVRQEVPIDPDNYLPPSAEASLNDQTASLDDISRLIRSIKIRDERLLQLETELRRSNDEYQRLNTELKPVFQMMKDRSKPLPYHPPGASPNDTEHHDNMTSPAFSHTQSDKGGSSLSRKFSTKRLFLNSASKGSSPTHIPSSILESRSAVESSNLDPSAAAVAASSHLMASTNGAPPTSSSPNTITLPSPTSPNTYANQPQLNARTYQYREGPGQQTPNTARPYYPSNDDTRDPYMSGSTMVESDREPRTATPNLNSMRQRRADRDDGQAPAPSNASVRSEAPSVEIFKSFRVSMEDPCYKVLPAALKKYQINADWRQYALYIVYGDQERCLGREEKPLILFKQLDREGKKPMFMLRRHAAPIEGHSGPSSGTAGAVGYDPAPTNARAATGIQFPPGGVL